MSPDTVIPENPDPRIRAEILGLLMAYNESKTGPSGFAPIAVVLEDRSGELIGGLWGRSVYDWLFVEHLFVPEHLRGRGLGTALMRKAEEVAIGRECIGVCLDTFDFNAPAFYRKLGYEVIAALESPRRGFKRHIFIKRLDARE
jgi:GNAT superfamily N-acetyltransferase